MRAHVRGWGILPQRRGRKPRPRLVVGLGVAAGWGSLIDRFRRGSRVVDVCHRLPPQLVGPLWKSLGVLICSSCLAASLPARNFLSHQLTYNQPLLRPFQISDERLDTRIGIVGQRLFETNARSVKLLKLGNRQFVPITIEFDNCVSAVAEVAKTSGICLMPFLRQTGTSSLGHVVGYASE